MRELLLGLVLFCAAGCMTPEKESMYEVDRVIETRLGYVFIIVDKQYNDMLDFWEYCVRSTNATHPDDVIWIAEDELQEVIEFNETQEIQNTQETN